MREVKKFTATGGGGFTLAELLIVIVILGILATVTVFAVRGITDQGQGAACATEVDTLAAASKTSTLRLREPSLTRRRSCPGER
jgi:prepilin-type N-terminal cleavage/methylation domain-containing protein